MTTLDITYDIPNLGCLLGMAYQAELSRLNKVLNESGLGITAAEYLIIRLLHSRGEMQNCEIGRTLNKDKAAISRSIKFLEKKGFVKVNQLSYKCSLVSLSDTGTALAPRLLEIAERLQKRLADRVSRQDLELLRKILMQIIK